MASIRVEVTRPIKVCKYPENFIEYLKKVALTKRLVIIF